MEENQAIEAANALQDKLINIAESLIPTALSYCKMLIVAIVLLVAGFWLIKKIVKGTKSILEAKNVDAMLTPFVVSVLSISLKTLLIVSVISYIGIPMTSFVAMLGAAGLAIGMAFSGTLQNFAGGIILLILKPFRVGDFIEAQGYAGTVREIQLFNTFITTGDNKVIILPNGNLATGSMINYSRMPNRRVDLTFSIGYSDSIDSAYAAIKSVIAKNEKILTTPAPTIAVSSLGDSSVNIVCRVWANTESYWEVFFYMNEFVKKEFDNQGISIPFPQQDVHIITK